MHKERGPDGEEMRGLKGWLPVSAALVGALLTGLGALYFALAENWAGSLSERIMANSPLWMLAIMPLGLGIILYLRDNYFQGTDGTGIPQTIASLKMGPGPDRGHLLSIRVAFGKLVLTTMGLFSFFSIGREGPSVQLGACFMNLVTRWTTFPTHLVSRGLILGGGAAGIAAAFNAPIAGIVFACEEIGRSFEKENMGTLVRTVLVACVVTALVLGKYYFYGRISYGALVPLEFFQVGPWLAVFVIGIVGGLLGGLFSSLLLFLMPKVGRIIRHRFWAVALVFGLLAGTLAVVSGGLTLGSGYEQARALVLQGSPGYMETLSEEEQARIESLAPRVGPAYPFMRACASLLVLLTGIPGGLFDPSFSVGAGLGKIFAPWLAWTGTTSQAVILLFIVAYFSGVVQSPMTAFIILIEMTGSISFTIPLAGAAIIAFEMSRCVCRVPLYEALAENFLRRTQARAGA